MQIHRVDTRRCQVGEGALWYADEQALYFLDITGHKVHRYEPASGVTRSWETPGAVGSMALRQGGGAVVAMKDTVHALDLETGACAPLARLEGAHPRATFNDGKVDRRGRYLIGLCEGDMSDPQPIGGLYSLGADHRFRELDRGIHFSNSPCFSPDGSTLYFADSLPNAVWAYDYEQETGQASGKRLFADTTELGGMPDGATTDSDGLVWMAIFRAGKLAAFRPDGKVEHRRDAGAAGGQRGVRRPEARPALRDDDRSDLLRRAGRGRRRRGLCRRRAGRARRAGTPLRRLTEIRAGWC